MAPRKNFVETKLCKLENKCVYVQTQGEAARKHDNYISGVQNLGRDKDKILFL